MAANDSITKVLVNDRQMPTPENQNIWGNARASRYGELFTQPMPLPFNVLAREGSLFHAHNTTNDAATTLAGHAAPLLADADATMTKPFIFVRVPASVTKYVELVSIEIEVVTAGAAATQACWAAQLDTGATRLSSGGTALTIVNPNMQSASTSVLAATNSLLGGAVVVGAEGANYRDLGFGTLRPSIEIAGDRKVFVFGADPSVVGAQSDAAATAIRTSIVALPSVILGATDQFLLALHGQASQTNAGVYKVRMTWLER